MIAVIDYGMGNLRSVHKALEVVGARNVKITSRAKDLEKSDKLVFPGVGAFGEAMRELRHRRLIQPIKDAIDAGKYFLGLCLGLQLLFESSEEALGVKGLCVLKGEVRRFRSDDLKVPHMGWNDIAYSLKLKAKDTKIFKGVPNGSYMYFVHSYYVRPKDKAISVATTRYGIEFVSGIQKDSVIGLQFHPEKSQDLGLKILENFVRLK